MATATAPRRPNRYLELVHAFPLRPLKSDAELDQAIAMIDRLVTRARLSAGERDYLEVLSDLVHKYEAAAHPIPPAPPSEVLRYLMVARGINQVELAAATGIAVSTISEVLSGKRGLSRKNIPKLARFFAVTPTVFV
jgi:HTH-type transcriptional regulator/antitoxin HigA